jgi:hypothetical protein
MISACPSPSTLPACTNRPMRVKSFRVGVERAADEQVETVLAGDDPHQVAALTSDDLVGHSVPAHAGWPHAVAVTPRNGGRFKACPGIGPEEE